MARTEITITVKIKRRAGKRFPFRARTKAEQPLINALVSDALDGVERMIRSLVRRNCQSGRFSEHDIEDIVQMCRIWLWERSLPKYDAWRMPRVKLSTFLYRCVANFVGQEVRRRLNGRPTPISLTDAMSNCLLDQDQPDPMVDDRRIEQIAKYIMAHPEEYFTPIQTRVFKALLANPHTKREDLATQLGYTRASPLSMLFRRICDKIMALDINEQALKQPRQSHSSRPARRPVAASGTSV